ncbi:hypothetical protein ACN2WE_40890 [Streptomyces sp. cg28]|uniref:hypothetical protein n=1 Tax=Streptomyces sp. cg28 TaxID=3403457 RepID=UPI003B21E8CC
MDGAVRALDAKAGSGTVTTDDHANLREVATAVNNIRAEKVTRLEAAAGIEKLAASVRGDEEDEAVTASDESATPAEPEVALEPEPAPVIASVERPAISRARPSIWRALPRASSAVRMPSKRPVGALS